MPSRTPMHVSNIISNVRRSKQPFFAFKHQISHFPLYFFQSTRSSQYMKTLCSEGNKNYASLWFQRSVTLIRFFIGGRSVLTSSIHLICRNIIKFRFPWKSVKFSLKVKSKKSSSTVSPKREPRQCLRKHLLFLHAVRYILLVEAEI